MYKDMLFLTKAYYSNCRLKKIKKEEYIFAKKDIFKIISEIF